MHFSFRRGLVFDRALESGSRLTGSYRNLAASLQPPDVVSDRIRARFHMTKIPGRLLADLHPNGTVRIVFIAGDGGGNETPFTAKNLDAAEVTFMTWGLRRYGLRKYGQSWNATRFAV